MGLARVLLFVYTYARAVYIHKPNFKVAIEMKELLRERARTHSLHLEVQDRLMRSKHVLHYFLKFTDAAVSNVVYQISGLSNFREFRITLWATKAFVRFMN